MISFLLTLAMGWSGVSEVVRCQAIAPHPTGYFGHGLTLTADGGGRIVQVAEVFPRGHRHNTGPRPIVHLYETVSRQPEFSLDATRLWTAELVNPVMPAAALVSPEGYFVTLDDWASFGGDRSVVIYAPDGRRVRTFSLDQLFEADVGRVVVAIGCGRHWREGTTYYFTSGADRKLYIVTAAGPVVELTLRTGAVSRGTLTDFATLRDLIAQGAEIQPASYALNLRFSSITDVKR